VPLKRVPKAQSQGKKGEKRRDMGEKRGEASEPPAREGTKKKNGVFNHTKKKKKKED